MARTLQKEQRTVYVTTVRVEAQTFEKTNKGTWEYVGPGSTDYEREYTAVASESHHVAENIADKLVDAFPELHQKDQDTTNWFNNDIG